MNWITIDPRTEAKTGKLIKAPEGK